MLSGCSFFSLIFCAIHLTKKRPNWGITDYMFIKKTKYPHRIHRTGIFSTWMVDLYSKYIMVNVGKYTIVPWIRHGYYSFIQNADPGIIHSFDFRDFTIKSDAFGRKNNIRSGSHFSRVSQKFPNQKIACWAKEIHGNTWKYYGPCYRLPKTQGSP